MAQQILGQGGDMYGLRATGARTTDWCRLLTSLLYHSEECVASIPTSSRKMTMAIVQSMARVKDDIVTPQRREGPVTHAGPDTHNTWDHAAWGRK
eukprot:14532346-Alexandrium_andersonii.AAC.1